jgi:hypothetical protein
MSKPAEKVLCQTPTPGKKPTRIDAWKYTTVRDAILSSLPSDKPGVVFMELPALVETQLSHDSKARLGSVGWYTTTVKLDLEVKGEIVRIPGSKPQRLIKTV